MRSIHLHIGTHKTGSSALQRYLVLNRGALAAEGFHVPPPGTGNHSLANHRGLARLGKAKTKDGEFSWSELAAYLPTVDGDVVLSAEDLEGRLANPRHTAFVSEFVRNLGVRLNVIVYLRDQPGYFNSRYGQSVRQFECAEDFDTYLSANIGALWFDYPRLLRPLMADKTITLDVRSYERARKDIGADFVRAISGGRIDTAGFQGVGQINTTFGPKTMLAGRRLSAALAARSDDPRALGKPLRAPFNKLVADRGWNEERFCGLDDETARRIRETFRARNDRIAQTFWGADWGAIVPPAPFSRVIIDEATASKDTLEDVNRVVNAVLAHLDG